MDIEARLRGPYAPGATTCNRFRNRLAARKTPQICLRRSRRSAGSNVLLGGITRGWIETQPVYARIFEGPAQVYVEYYDHTLCETGEMFCTVGGELGHYSVSKEGTMASNGPASTSAASTPC